MKQNPGKIGFSIQAVLKVVSAPARFWERGARCFVMRRGSTIGEGGDTTISSPGRSPKQPRPGRGLHDPLHGP